MPLRLLLFRFWALLYVLYSLCISYSCLFGHDCTKKGRLYARRERGVSFSHTLFIKTLAMPEEIQKRTSDRMGSVIARRKGEYSVKLQPHDVQGVAGEDSASHVVLARNGRIVTAE